MNRARWSTDQWVEQRAAYRRWIRENHPDVGGDPHVFAAGLARYRAVGAGRRPPDRYDAPIVIVPDSDRIRRSLRRFWRRLCRTGPTRVR